MSKEITNEQILAGSAVKGDNGKPVGRNTAIEVFDAMVGAAPAIANKATEEGELPALPLTKSQYGFDHTLSFCAADMYEYARQAIAADRTSRQVANKAEVEPVAFMTSDKKMLVFAGAMRKLQFDPAGMIALYEYPPTTTGASTELRDDLRFSYNAPEVESYVVKNSAFLSNGLANFYAYLSVQAESFDKWEKCVAECADGAKEVVELQFKVGDQEWAGSFRELFKILAKPVGASTVLTDERIEELIAQVPDFDIGNYDLHLLARHVEREVAAQAGQVAVPGWISVDDRLPEFRHECTSSGCEVSDSLMVYGQNEFGTTGCGFGHARDDGTWSTYETEYYQLTVVKVTHWMPLPAAPSPAKESK